MEMEGASSNSSNTFLDSSTPNPNSSKKHGSIVDFFIGFGMVYGIGAILGGLLALAGIIIGGVGDSYVFNPLSMFFGGLFSIFGIANIVIPLIAALILARKYFPNRKMVRVGAWVAFILPILLVLIMFGACLIGSSGSGW